MCVCVVCEREKEVCTHEGGGVCMCVVCEREKEVCTHEVGGIATDVVQTDQYTASEILFTLPSPIILFVR